MLLRPIAWTLTPSPPPPARCAPRACATRTTARASTTSSATLAGGEGKNDGMFLSGWSGRQTSPWGNGTIFQCVRPPTKRAGLLQGVGENGS